MIANNCLGNSGIVGVGAEVGVAVGTAVGDEVSALVLITETVLLPVFVT